MPKKKADVTQDFDCYNIDRMLFRPDKRKNLKLVESKFENFFQFLSVMDKDLLTPPMSTISVESNLARVVESSPKIVN